MADIKCIGCNKKIAEGDISNGAISIKCKCGTTTTISARPADKKEGYIHNQPYQHRLNLAVK